MEFSKLCCCYDHPFRTEQRKTDEKRIFEWQTLHNANITNGIGDQ